MRGIEGDIEHFDGVLEDVSEQHVANERFRAAFEDSPSGTLTYRYEAGYALFRLELPIPGKVHATPTVSQNNL